MLAHFRSTEVFEAVQYPLAATSEEVKQLLDIRPSQREEVIIKMITERGKEPDGEASDGGNGSSSGVKSAKDVKKEAAALAISVKNSILAYDDIVKHIPDSVFQLVQHVHPGDAHGVWKVLLGKYERKTTASRHLTRGLLHRCKLEAGESFDSYFARLTQLRTRLQLMGSTVPDDEIIYILLKGLPKDYENIVENLRMRDDKTLEAIADHIRDAQERKIVERVEEAAAHYVKHPPSTPTKNFNSKQGGRGGGGFGGGRSSSSSSSSFNSNPNPNRRFQRRDEGCWMCGERGHAVRLVNAINLWFWLPLCSSALA